MSADDADAEVDLPPEFLIRRPLSSKSGVMLQRTDDGEWYERDLILSWPTLEIRVRGTVDLVYPMALLHYSMVFAMPDLDCEVNGQRVHALQIRERQVESEEIEEEDGAGADGLDAPLKRVVTLFAASKQERESWAIALRKHAVHVDIENGFILDGLILGKGNYATVYLAKDVCSDKKVALKVIEKDRLTEEERKLLADEVLVSKAADNAFCVKTLEFIELGMQYVLVVEYMEGGDLYDRVVCEQYGQVDVKHLFRQLLIGVAHLHSRDLCHRDLKPENFLLTGERPFSVKIADFGIATRVDPRQRETSLKDGPRLRCSPGYGAPEVVRRERYGLPADMWSVGVLLYFMLTGLSPFHGINKDETLKLMSEGRYDRAPLRKHGPAVIDLVTRLLELNPARRLTAEQALRHPWVCETVLMTVEEPETDESLDTSSHGGFPTRLMGAKLEGAFRNPSLHEMSIERPKDKDLLLDVSVHDMFWKNDTWTRQASAGAMPPAPAGALFPSLDEVKQVARDTLQQTGSDSDVCSRSSLDESDRGRRSFDVSPYAGRDARPTGSMGAARGKKKSSFGLSMISSALKKVSLKPKVGTDPDQAVHGLPNGE